MYINKLIKKQVMLILATVVLVGTLAVTTSFAVFEETKSNVTDQKMTIGNLDVTYTGGSAISITDINPMTDSTALSKTNNIYTFTIKNTGTVPYNFKVKVIDNPSYTSNLLPHQYIRYSLNNGAAGVLGTGQADYELTSGVIEAGVTNTYNLRLWVADADTYKLPNSALGQEIHLKISVEGKAGSGWLPSNFKDRILALNEVKPPITTPGKEISSESEALLASTEDDYGTSYYFRGSVTNNYVEFANKCWRIVRITGDGSVKLVLHNDNTSGTSNPCLSANNSEDAAFINYGNIAFNLGYNDNRFIGLMFGVGSASDYESAHANTNKSKVLTNLESWYKNNLLSYESKLADTIWCNDKSTSSGLGYGANETTYSAYNRLTMSKIPSLICPNDNNGGKLSKFTVDDTIHGNGDLTYKIGLLTADEMVFAGYMSDEYNFSTYLQENTGNHSGWWSISPYDLIIVLKRGNAAVFCVEAGHFHRCPLNVAYRIRPSISLLSTVTATGTGTSEDPYVVQ